MKTSVPPISLAGSELGEVRHVCALFNSDDEEYRVLLPFIKEGFECGDSAIHVVNPDQRVDHLRRLSVVGIDTAAAQHRANSIFERAPRRIFETAASIRIGCWRYSSRQPAAMPRVGFRSAASSAAWTGRRKAVPTSIT